MGITQHTGQQAERLACRYLEQQGLELVQRNFTTRYGEIDLVMRWKDSVVFVEVRYRQNPAYGHAAETVTVAKQRRIIRCAARYLQQKSLDVPARFDVVSLEQHQGETQIHWIPDAFRA